MQPACLDFFFEEFATEQMDLLYTGDFSDEHTETFIELNNQQFAALDEIKISYRKAAFLIAECFQNIVRHHDPSHQDSYFHIQIKEGLFSIVSGNRIENQHIASLKEQLEQLNELTSEELKSVYRKSLFEGKVSEKGGAGLGLIEMARKSKNKLSFKFSEIDDKTSYFYFSLHLKWEAFEGNTASQDFNRSIKLRSHMLSEQLLFIYKGVISIKTTIQIFKILDQSLQSAQQKVLFLRFMGLFEKLNITPLPNKAENAAILLMGEKEDYYDIGASCLLNLQQARSFEIARKFYANYNQDRLSQERKRLFKEGGQGYEFNLMLIDLLSNEVDFTFDFQTQTECLAKVNFTMKFSKKKRSSYTKVSPQELNRELIRLEEINS